MANPQAIEIVVLPSEVDLEEGILFPVVEIEVGLTLPGEVEIYYGTTVPDPELGGEGALYVQYIPTV